LFGREAVRVLPRDDPVADPHRELAPVALDDGGLDPGGLPDQRRRTGGAGIVVSNPAVANRDARHDL
jgi:hypothetical protein